MSSVKSVLVTGAGGYVGSVLCRQLLEQGYAVRALDNLYKGNVDALIPLARWKQFEFIKGDVLDYQTIGRAVDGVDAIVALAALVGYPACAKNEYLAFGVNVEGTLRTLQAKKPHQKFILASTGSVYGKIAEDCTEDTTPNPLTVYGKTKLEAEQYTKLFANTLIYRFATGYGVSPCMRVNLLMNDFVKQAMTSRCLTVFEPDARRTFIHVEDMADAFIFGLKNFDHLSHQVYNVGSDAGNLTKREIAEFIKAKYGTVVNYEEFAKDLDARDYKVDYSRIAAEGWQPSRKPLDEVEELVKVCEMLRPDTNYA